MAFGVLTSTRRGIILHHTLLAVFLLATFNENVLKSTPSKSFRRVTNRNGTDLCPLAPAGAPPYATIEIDKLDLPEISIDCPPAPPETLCSWKCTMEPNCTSVVWRTSTNMCEFYSTAPQACTAEVFAQCIHFESNIGQTSCTDEVLSITADNQIKHLYIDAFEITDLPNGKEWGKSDNVSLPMTASVIAVEVINDAGDVGGLLASTDTICTDGTWKVTTNYTEGWMNVTFDDSDWKNVTTYGYNGVDPWSTQPAISRNAQWIASDNKFDNNVYFRYQLKRRRNV